MLCNYDAVMINSLGYVKIQELIQMESILLEAVEMVYEHFKSVPFEELVKLCNHCCIAAVAS